MGLGSEDRRHECLLSANADSGSSEASCTLMSLQSRLIGVRVASFATGELVAQRRLGDANAGKASNVFDLADGKVAKSGLRKCRAQIDHDLYQMQQCFKDFLALEAPHQLLLTLKENLHPCTLYWG